MFVMLNGNPRNDSSTDEASGLKQAKESIKRRPNQWMGFGQKDTKGEIGFKRLWGKK